MDCRVYNIGIEVRQGRGRYCETNIVTFTPRYQLDNRSSHKLAYAQRHFASQHVSIAAHLHFFSFWATITSNGPPFAIGLFSCLSVLSVCNVGVLWPNGWMDQDATWYIGKPRPRRHCVRRGHSSPMDRGAALPLLFGPRLLWPNGCPSQQLLSSCSFYHC